jgi:hypothetical protein
MRRQSAFQAKVALHKAANRALYCRVRRCLWRVSVFSDTRCVRHPDLSDPVPCDRDTDRR